MKKIKCHGIECCVRDHCKYWLKKIKRTPPSYVDKEIQCIKYAKTN